MASPQIEAGALDRIIRELDEKISQKFSTLKIKERQQKPPVVQKGELNQAKDRKVSSPPTKPKPEAITVPQQAGWIKLYRVALPWLRNHKLWAFWCYCLLKASHRVHKVFIGNQQVELSPGQFILGRKIAALETGLSEQNIRTCIKSLENLKNLTIKSTNKYSLITIVNWTLYQSNDEKVTSKTTDNQPAPNQHLTTYKNVKNDKNDIYTSDFLSFYEVYPKKIAKPLAYKAWQKIAPANGTLEAVMAGLKKWKESPDWQKDNGQYIPHPATWLNHRRWEDEIPEPAKKWNEA